MGLNNALITLFVYHGIGLGGWQEARQGCGGAASILTSSLGAKLCGELSGPGPGNPRRGILPKMKNENIRRDLRRGDLRQDLGLLRLHVWFWFLLLLFHSSPQWELLCDLGASSFGTWALPARNPQGLFPAAVIAGRARKVSLNLGLAAASSVSEV